jgi:hypothetical protein
MVEFTLAIEEQNLRFEEFTAFKAEDLLLTGKEDYANLKMVFNLRYGDLI